MFSWISQGLEGIIEHITQGVINQENFYDEYKKIYDENNTKLQDAMNNISDNIKNNHKSLSEILTGIFNFLNPFSEDFFVYKLIEMLGDLLKGLFIPSEERITAITNTVSSKFGFIDSIKEAINSLQNMLNNVGNSPKLETTNIESKYYNGKLTVIDMSWYAPFKPYGDLVITGFVYLFFLWRIFVHAPSIIRGTGGDLSNIGDKGAKL